jgi:hypothetical protein
MISNEKDWNYKVLGLVELFNLIKGVSPSETT